MKCARKGCPKPISQPTGPGRRRRWCSGACREWGRRARRRLSVHFSSKSDEWATPQATFDALARELGPFDLDVCASHANAKCPRYYTADTDGLALPWEGRCWMNPPYGREIGRWMDKAALETWDGRAELVVCLVPARVGTRWWIAAVERGAEVRFLPGRLKFGGSANTAPFPSAVLVFRHGRRVTESGAGRGEG